MSLLPTIALQHAYTWHVLYDNQETLHEFSRSDGLGWAEVEHARVVMVLLEPTRDTLPKHGIAIPKDALPIFFRRKSTTTSLGDGSSIPRDVIHCIGWIRGDEGVYHFLFDNGVTLVTSDLQAV